MNVSMRSLILSAAILSFSFPAVSQQKDTSKTPPAATKPTVSVPADLSNGLIKIEALNAAITDIKNKDGITALEKELQEQGQSLEAQAEKEGFRFDPKVQNFVSILPPVNADKVSPVKQNNPKK